VLVLPDGVPDVLETRETRAAQVGNNTIAHMNRTPDWTSPQMLRRYGTSRLQRQSSRRSYDRIMDAAPLPEAAEGNRLYIPPREISALLRGGDSPERA
jgi:hypothetical protein